MSSLYSWVAASRLPMLPQATRAVQAPAVGWLAGCLADVGSDLDSTAE